MVLIETNALCSSQLKEGENGQTQMKFKELVPEVTNVGDTHQTSEEDSQIQAQANDCAAYAYNDLVLDAENDVEDWWHQIDVLAEQPTKYDVRISPEIQRHPECVSPELTTHLTTVHVQQIQKAIQGDNTLQLFIQQMLEAWPEHSSSLPLILRPLWQAKEDPATEHSSIT